MMKEGGIVIIQVQNIHCLIYSMPLLSPRRLGESIETFDLNKINRKKKHTDHQ